MNRTTVERASDRELVIRRTFNGPARMVFDAWTKPELMKRWIGPRRLTMTASSSLGVTGTPRVKRCGSSISNSEEKELEWPG